MHVTCLSEFSDSTLTAAQVMRKPLLAHTTRKTGASWLSLWQVRSIVRSADSESLAWKLSASPSLTFLFLWVLSRDFGKEDKSEGLRVRWRGQRASSGRAETSRQGWI